MTQPTLSAAKTTVPPAEVLDSLRRHMLVDGYPFVLDLDRSQGCWLVDSVTGTRYLDMFSFFASAPLGINHPHLRSDEVMRKLGRVAVNKPSNSDFYTVEMAEFVHEFTQRAVPADLPHLFLISGGGPAVENGLKAAFDWKVQRNLARGREPRGSQVVHFAEGFHGRTGYALSITSTPDDRKTRHFPVFSWPRITNPKMCFPFDDKNRAAVEALERRAIEEIDRAFDQHPDDIAAIIIEPIQGEGGDNHFRPEFLRELRRIADEREAMLIFDEVQTGLGMTGSMWAHDDMGVLPDVLVFGKKLQVCGIAVSNRIDEVERNVFVESSRINSTWGGNLVDMARALEYVRVIDEEDLIGNARAQGKRLIAGLNTLAAEFPPLFNQVRGRGLMCAFDLADAGVRPALLDACFARELIIAPTGAAGVRFRPALNVAAAEIDQALDRLRDAARAIS